MVTQATNMSLSSKREYLARIHGRYQRAGRPHKSRILDEFCLNCDYHRKAALRLLLGPGPGAFKKKPGPKRTYDPERLRPVLQIFWLASDAQRTETEALIDCPASPGAPLNAGPITGTASISKVGVIT
jgi:hypothetical protein